MMHPVTGAALVLIIGLMVVLFLPSCVCPPVSALLPQGRRNSPVAGGTAHEPRDNCLTKYGAHTELHYVYSTTQTFSFDLCNVINCKGYNESWRSYDVYLCIFRHGIPGHQKWCPNKCSNYLMTAE